MSSATERPVVTMAVGLLSSALRDRQLRSASTLLA